MWSTSPYVAKQIEGIGPSHAKSLAQANLINMEQLRNCDPGRLEMVIALQSASFFIVYSSMSLNLFQILHRNPPFGIKVSYRAL